MKIAYAKLATAALVDRRCMLASTANWHAMSMHTTQGKSFNDYLKTSLETGQ